MVPFPCQCGTRPYGGGSGSRSPRGPGVSLTVGQVRSCDPVASKKVLTVQDRDDGQLDARSARASQHGISASRSKTSPTANFVIYSPALTFHLHDRIFPFIHSWDIEPACFSQEIQGSPLLRGAHPINRENQAASRFPSSRNAYKTRPLTTQDARYAKTRRR